MRVRLRFIALILIALTTTSASANWLHVFLARNDPYWRDLVLLYLELHPSHYSDKDNSGRSLSDVLPQGQMKLASFLRAKSLEYPAVAKIQVAEADKPGPFNNVLLSKMMCLVSLSLRDLAALRLVSKQIRAFTENFAGRVDYEVTTKEDLLKLMFLRDSQLLRFLRSLSFDFGGHRIIQPLLNAADGSALMQFGARRALLPLIYCPTRGRLPRLLIQHWPLFLEHSAHRCSRIRAISIKNWGLEHEAHSCIRDPLVESIFKGLSAFPVLRHFDAFRDSNSPGHPEHASGVILDGFAIRALECLRLNSILVPGPHVTSALLNRIEAGKLKALRVLEFTNIFLDVGLANTFATLIEAGHLPELREASISELYQMLNGPRKRLAEALSRSQVKLVKLAVSRSIRLADVLEFSRQGGFAHLQEIDATQVADDMGLVEELPVDDFARTLPLLKSIVFNCHWLGASLWFHHLLKVPSNARVLQLNGFDTLVERFLNERDSDVLYRYQQETLARIARLPDAATEINPELDALRTRSQQLLKLVELEEEDEAEEIDLGISRAHVLGAMP